MATALERTRQPLAGLCYVLQQACELLESVQNILMMLATRQVTLYSPIHHVCCALHHWHHAVNATRGLWLGSTAWSIAPLKNTTSLPEIGSMSTTPSPSTLC